MMLVPNDVTKRLTERLCVLFVMDVVMKVQVQYQSKLYRPKIQKFVSTLNLTTQDRPNIVTRIFKLNLKQLMSDLKDKKLLGDVLACKLCTPNTLIN